MVFGAALPEYLYGHLNEGQCVMFHENGYHEGSVIVTRSPSYQPGDIRILDAVRPPQSLHRMDVRIKNVIFFATEGLLFYHLVTLQITDLKYSKVIEIT